MSDVELDYEYLTQRALRRVVADVLALTAELGETPGEHHFYIEFLTAAPGVSIPDDLKAAYAPRMTIVLQHQFEDLDVREEDFSVTLWFKGKAARLTIPYEAVTSFADPSVQFGLRFAEPLETAADKEAAPEKPPEPEKPAAPKSGADVVSLDTFRKK